MLIPKKNRVAIYENLFKEGVMVAKKEFNNPKHPDLETVPNLQVIKALQVRSRTHHSNFLVNAAYRVSNFIIEIKELVRILIKISICFWQHID